MSGKVGVRCAGCNLEEVHPWNGPGPEDDARIADMQSRGWMRRTFGPGASPWFCSEACAYNSPAALSAEQWWDNYEEEERQKEFERYCRENELPRVYFAIFGIIIALIAGLMYRGF